MDSPISCRSSTIFSRSSTSCSTVNVSSSHSLQKFKGKKTTFCDVQCTTFNWKINYPNYSLGCDIRSPLFSVDLHGNTRFYANILSEKEDESYNHISLYLAKHETHCGPSSIGFAIKTSVTDAGKEEYFSEENFSFGNQRKIFLGRLSIKKKKEYQSDHSLAVLLEIQPNGEKSSNDDDLFTCNQKELEMLSSDLGRALRAKRFCDLTFRSTEGKTAVLSLHKCILAARYPKMAEYLVLNENGRRECNLGVDCDTVSMLTQYLYTGNIDTADVPSGLYEILKKTHLHHLERVLYPTPRFVQASTSVSSKYGSFVWIIPKFSCLEEGHILINNFCIDTTLEWTKIRVLLYLQRNAEDTPCLVFKIVRAEQKGKLYMLCTISFGDENGKSSKTIEHVFRSDCNTKYFTENNSIWDKFLSGNSLKLLFEFVISDLVESLDYELIKCWEVKRERVSSVAMNLWALQRDMKNLFLDPSFSDCTLQVKGELMAVHKVILSARCPEFSKLFEGDTTENEPGSSVNDLVVIDAFEPCVIKSMLHFIYCGELPEESEYHILSLYKASQKYQVKQLREKCSRIIGNCLAVSMVADVLKIADEYNDEYLKECVENFVYCHAEEVFESEQWIALKKESIGLTASIMNIALDLDE